MFIDKAKIRNSFSLINKIVRYNLKIIFGNLFIYFLLAAFVFYLLIGLLIFFNSDTVPDAATVYYLLLFPGLLLIFYPTTFGIQHDMDNRMIEILFGIPDYRYKVWLVRMTIIYVLVFALLVFLSLLSFVAISEFHILTMVYQLMFPIFFIGCFAFMLSTWVRNGFGSMVILVAFGMAFWVLSGILRESEWNLFLNPFHIPEEISEVIWADLKMKNRLYILSATILMLLAGLLNLQKREKFI